MKIDELVVKLNELKSIRAENLGNRLRVYSNQNTGHYFFLWLFYEEKSLADVGADWNCLDDVKPADLYKALNLIDCFLHTPIDERSPEKKYRLRWIDDTNGSKNYIECPDYWSFEGLHPETFTEQELNDLKNKHPRFALAIDAMKEPVEDD